MRTKRTPSLLLKEGGLTVSYLTTYLDLFSSLTKLENAKFFLEKNKLDGAPEQSIQKAAVALAVMSAAQH